MDFHGSPGSPGLGGGRASAHRSPVAERDARGGAATSAVAGVWALFSDMAMDQYLLIQFLVG